MATSSDCKVTQEDGGLASNSQMSEHCADAWSCSICLDPIRFENLAVVKACEHTYCVQCILKWSCTKESETLCPTCKAPFSTLLVHRLLDGTLTDIEVEESVVLLARAVWFQSWLQEHERNRDLYKYPAFRSPAAAESDLPPDAIAREEWAEEAMYQYFEDEYEDEAVEDYYFSSQAGPSRVTFGNRRWGANGFVRSGHRCARPAAATNAPRVPKNTGKTAAGPCAVAKGEAAKGRAARAEGPGEGGSGSKSQGRRARRNAQRRADDVPGM